MNRCKYVQPIHPQVKFGVDLLEIYPPWYLHPGLKNLIYLAETNIRDRYSTRFDIEEILGLKKGCNGEGSVKHRLELKEHIMNGKDVLNMNIAPGVPVWVLRHFLGLLPTPIFSPKSDEHYWFHFSTRCYDQFVESIKKNSSTNDLKDTVAFEISHLPSRNLTLLFELFEMIRFLSMKSSSDDVIDKHAALLLVRYFVPSLFARPYRPGMFTKTDKKYFPFILFTVHFWPDLRIKIHDILTSSMNKNPNKFYYFHEEYDKYSDCNVYLKDKVTQTDCDSNFGLFLKLDSRSEDCYEPIYNRDNELLNTNEKINKITDDKKCRKIEEPISSTPRKEISSIVDKYYESIILNNKRSFLQTVSTQTIVPLENKQTKFHINTNKYPKFNKKINKLTLKGKKKKRQKKKIADTNIIILQIPNYQRKSGSKNLNIITYKKCDNKIIKRNKNQNLSLLNYNKDKKTKIKINSSNVKEEYKNNENSPKLNLNSSSVNYGWNSASLVTSGEYIYDSFVEKCYNETQTPLQARKLFDTPESKLKTVDLYQKITKYGWTYNKKKTYSEKSCTSLSNSFNNPYKLCFDNDEKSLRSLNSDTPLTETIKKKNLYNNLKKVGSKFGFLRSLTSSRLKVKSSVSCEDLNPKVKYEKIRKSFNTI